MIKNASISKKIMKQVGQTNARFGLIGEGDKILLGLSGGKDSLTLAHVLKEQRRRAPFNFEFIAVTISYGMGEDLTRLHDYCLEHGIEHHIYDTNIYELSNEKIRQNSSYCSFFSRMRRGSLYSAAQHFGCNKVALGHHMDDAVESYFMNLFYNGAMRTLAPIYKAERGVTVIRPLIQVRERQLIAAALDNAMPTVGDEACPSMRFDVKPPHVRAKMKTMMASLETQFPDLFVSMNAAFGNLHVETFFDTHYHQK